MAPRTRSDPPSDATDPALPLKRQARRRLLGAIVLASAVAIGFALFFDAEPRPTLDDVQVRIPARDSPLPDRAGAREPVAAATGAAPAAPAVPEPPAASGAPPGSAPASSVAPEASTSPAPAPAEPAQPASAAESPRAATPEPSPALSAAGAGAAAAAASARSSAAGTPAGTSAASASAPVQTPKAEAKSAASVDTPKSQGYFLQVGAFASEKAARDQVERIRRLGATAFTERIRTQQGERIRVRLGPFPTRDASDALRQRLRAAGIDVTLVSP